MKKYFNEKKYMYDNNRHIISRTTIANEKIKIKPEDISKKLEIDKEIRNEITSNFYELLKKQSFTENDKKSVTLFVESFLKEKQIFFVEPTDKVDFVASIINEIFGLGVLESLINDSRVTEIWTIGSQKIFYEQDGKTIQSSLKFKDDISLVNIINKILAPINRKVDESNPRADGRLSNGSRISVTIPPVALNGPSLTIRKFKEGKFLLSDYVRIGSASKEMAEFLRLVVKGRLNILVSGGTGSGKTTLLNALSSEIEDEERIITIEDAAELKMDQNFVSAWETKTANAEGVGAITISELVKHALRNSPDRIVIGEIRDKVAYDLLQAANTGHDGTLSTTHANDSRGAIKRVADLASQSGLIDAIEAQESFCDAFDLVVSIKKIGHERKITQITYVAGVGARGFSKLKLQGEVEPNRVYLQDLFVYNVSEGRYVSSGFIPTELIHKLKDRGVDLPFTIFTKTQPIIKKNFKSEVK